MDVFQFSPKFRLCLSLWCLHVVVVVVLLLLSTPVSISTFKTAGAAAAAAPASVSGNETDRLSLLAFKEGMAGHQTGALRSWNDSLHYCQWRGVECGRRHPDRVTNLALRSLGLRGHISPSITNLSFLREIDLSDNLLDGLIPPQLGALFRLRYLNLSYNSLRGEIPSNISLCSKLTVLHLKHNQLVGEIPVALGNLPQLVRLNIDSNQISGAIPTSLGNLTSNLIQDIFLGANSLTGAIPSELGRLTNLRVLVMGENGLSGTLPSSLYNLSNLVALEVILNQLSGTLPTDLGITLPNLTYLGVGGNHFSGNIPSSITNASSLQIIDIAENVFVGTIPGNIGMLTELNVLNAAGNRLEAREPKDWEFLTSLANCTHLKKLAIFVNELGGALPASIANLSTNLEILQIGRNQISGTVPEGIGNLNKLRRLEMQVNRFHGGIPFTLGKLNGLGTLDLHQNQLSGEIPSELGNLTLLNQLYLQRNNLSGGIPKSFGGYRQLRELHMFSNSLDGRIPDELFTLYTLVNVNLSNNLFGGSLPSNVGRLINLEKLDLSANKLSGYLPSSLGECQTMQVLILYGNSFEGTIPPSLSNLKGIELLDLSLNNLSGKIPEFLQNLKVLEFLNLSFNNFMGEVPRNGVFANASDISLLGNKMICGGISALQLPKCASEVEKKGSRSHSLKIIVLPIIGGLCFLLSLCFLIYLYWTRQSSGETSTASSFESRHRRISYHDLVKATNGFSNDNFLGRGSFGSVYKGVLYDEKMIAVKVFNTLRQGSSKSFKHECDALRNIRHRNLVKIVSVCSSVDFSGNDFKALVFEFFSNGSLEKWLHPEFEVEMRSLGFAQRLCIANDVASALDYLHNHGHSPLVHCDLKPSNVLLDDNMIAHVTDFGLARFILGTSNEMLESQSSTIGVKGTIGYVAPEYGLGSHVSTYGDVYSFGILLLELFTAKRPTDDNFKDGLNLQKIVEMALSEQPLEVIDPRLIQLSNDEDNSCLSRERVQYCFISLMRIGLNCTKESPQERMAMGDVVRKIHLVQNTFLGYAPSTTS